MTRDSEGAPLPAAGGTCASFKEGYRWTCPYCGKSRTNASGGRAGTESAVAALRSHIQASDGAGHGPRNELSTDGDVADLEAYVVVVDGRRDSTDGRRTSPDV